MATGPTKGHRRRHQRGAPHTRDTALRPAPLSLAASTSASVSARSGDSADDARLLRAIQALDSVQDASGVPEQQQQHQQHQQRGQQRGVMRALAHFLELAMLMQTSNVAGDAHRKRVTVVLEARVLACVKRFMDSKAPWRSWLCSERMGSDNSRAGPPCVVRLISAVVACFLFVISRDAATAPLVVRSGLHRCLFELSYLASDLVTTDQPNGDMNACRVDGCVYASEDVLVGVDPYEWATQSVCAMLRQDLSRCAVFLLPIGPRTLMHMLNGHRVPANETEEFGIWLQSHGSGVSTVSGSLKRRPRHLPSIFKFSATKSGSDAPNCSDTQCTLCSPAQDDLAWKTILCDSTRQQFAIRAIAALALHLHPASPERKQFIRDGGYRCLHQASLPIEPSMLASGGSSRVGYLENGRTFKNRHQNPIGSATNTMHTHDDDSDARARAMVQGIAAAGLRRFTRAEVSGSPSDLRNPTPSPKEITAVALGMHSKGASSLDAKLRSVSEEARRSMETQVRVETQRQFEEERFEVRVRVGELYERATQVREHLVRSLAIMGTGREHPNARQPLVEWLDAFPTIEKKEQQRREEEELRQRRIMEVQYQIDERRRREAEERTRMAGNDYNIPDSIEKSQQEERRAQFVKLREEMQELKAREDREVEEQANEHALILKRQIAQEEARRAQQVLAERRLQELERQRMSKEDHYYAERILREKQQRGEQARQARLVDPIAEQKKRIEKMKLADAEKARSDREIEAMRTEDVFGRQMRLILMELRSKDKQREWMARKDMENEEKETRVRWRQVEQMIVKQEEEARRRARGEQRRMKRQQEQERKAWTGCYDAYGNMYYYNQLTGATQWENPHMDASAETWGTSGTAPSSITP